ncbi:MarR family winged helix-turn-helix transcriptional regulator [Nocardia sp. NPDC088792]|uniref:MarR family winged helix-turn-helix transcriptional regulator n=1 Tax=Nocardia sp. NPDC088792 TaxID=3364332 RepID=UPI00380B3FCC
MTAKDEYTADELLDAVGPAFGKLRRGVLREVENPLSAKDMSRTLVLNIVAEQSESPGSEVTVGGLAEHLCIDPSVASRTVTDSIKAGYLMRVPSQRDGRRAVLRLTPAGHELMARFRHCQREAFENITADWLEHDRLEFARLMLQYVDSIERLRDRRTAREVEAATRAESMQAD